MKEQDRFELVYDIAETMLENGAEIKRIESTIHLVAKTFNLQEFNSFVLINGIFMTARCDDELIQAKVKDIPISPIILGRIDKINSLSRKITEGRVTPEEAKLELESIKSETYASNPLKIFAYAFGSASFCYVFGGTIWDSFGSLFLGTVLALYIIYITPKLRLSKMIITITSSMLVSILACILVELIPPLKLTSLVTGGIISLLPGVPIVNGIRYLFDEDYTSGWGQMINALITALSVSVGVGLVLRVFNLF